MLTANAPRVNEEDTRRASERANQIGFGNDDMFLVWPACIHERIQRTLDDLFHEGAVYPQPALAQFPTQTPSSKDCRKENSSPVIYIASWIISISLPIYSIWQPIILAHE